MTKTKPAAKKKAAAFQHAADLPDAYRELHAAISKVAEGGSSSLTDFHLHNLTALSMISLWNKADEKAAAWARVAAAARRVQVAFHGAKESTCWPGFVPSKAA